MAVKNTFTYEAQEFVYGYIKFTHGALAVNHTAGLHK